MRPNIAVIFRDAGDLVDRIVRSVLVQIACIVVGAVTSYVYLRLAPVTRSGQAILGTPYLIIVSSLEA